jgi:hypothetical protein
VQWSWGSNPGTQLLHTVPALAFPWCLLWSLTLGSRFGRPPRAAVLTGLWGDLAFLIPPAGRTVSGIPMTTPRAVRSLTPARRQNPHEWSFQCKFSFKHLFRQVCWWGGKVTVSFLCEALLLNLATLIQGRETTKADQELGTEIKKVTLSPAMNASRGQGRPTEQLGCSSLPRHRRFLKIHS